MGRQPVFVEVTPGYAGSHLTFMLYRSEFRDQMMLEKIGWDCLLRFALAGGTATTIHFTVMLLLVYAGIAPVPATAVGALLGALANYVLQRSFTFRSYKPHSACVPDYIVANLGFMLGNVMLFAVLQTAFQMSPFFAQALTTALMALLTYQTYLRVIFHERLSSNTTP